jgi:hypothetical protein
MSKEEAGPKEVGGIEVRGWGILDEMNSVLSGNRPPSLTSPRGQPAGPGQFLSFVSALSGIPATAPHAFTDGSGATTPTAVSRES